MKFLFSIAGAIFLTSTMLAMERITFTEFDEFRFEFEELTEESNFCAPEIEVPFEVETLPQLFENEIVFSAQNSPDVSWCLYHMSSDEINTIMAAIAVKQKKRVRFADDVPL